MQEQLVDAFGRTITYLRLSVTDRCTLRCRYCQSSAATTFIPHESILHYEEMLRCVRIVHAMGVKKLRLSGGEPLLRKGCDAFIVLLRATFPELDLRITTNGTLLEGLVPLLQRERISAVNLSLDTFDAATFEEITGKNELGTVLAALDALRAHGIRVKLNAVALRGRTEKELDRFIEAAKTWDIDVRFIEFMPMGRDTIWSEEHFCSVQTLKSRAEQMVGLTPVPSTDPTDGPARMYALAGGRGRLGFISAITEHFCASCNRLRLTSEGALRLCLFDDNEYPLRPLLRDPRVADAQVARQIRAACQHKPFGVKLLESRKQNAVAKRSMSGIGG